MIPIYYQSNDAAIVIALVLSLLLLMPIFIWLRIILLFEETW